MLLDRAYDRELLSLIFLDYSGIRQLAFRHILKGGFGNFYETWNSIPFLSHVIKILVGSGSVYTRL